MQRFARAMPRTALIAAMHEELAALLPAVQGATVGRCGGREFWLGAHEGQPVVAEALLQHDMDASPPFPRHEVALTGLSRFPVDLEFSARVAESRALRVALPDALAVEMEGAAVAQVCHAFGAPLAVVRTISDQADDAAHVDFISFLRDVAGPLGRAIVQEALAP